MKYINKINYVDVLITLIGIILAIAVRYSLVEFKSVDYFKYTRDWYNTIKSEGFSAFSQNFSNYNPPYLYLLYLIARILPNSSAVFTTKLPSMIADFISAVFVYQIVRFKYINYPIPLLSAFAVLFSPTIVINSAFWGQADALYTCALLAALYFLISKNYLLTFLSFGLSISFKAQAVFLFPVLVVLLIRKEIPWKYFLLIPLVMLLALVPAWFAGRSLVDLLLVYPSQAGQYNQLSMHAPTVFSWIPDTGRYYIYFYTVGLIVTILIGLLFCFIVYKSQKKITTSILIELALISVLIIPFFLPKMHERNFYPADIISIIFAFYHPRFIFAPISMSVISFFAYQPTLFNVEPISIGILAFGIFILIVILCRDVLIKLFLPYAWGDSLKTQ